MKAMQHIIFFHIVLCKQYHSNDYPNNVESSPLKKIKIVGLDISVKFMFSKIETGISICMQIDTHRYLSIICIMFTRLIPTIVAVLIAYNLFNTFGENDTVILTSRHTKKMYYISLNFETHEMFN